MSNFDQISKDGAETGRIRERSRTGACWFVGDKTCGHSQRNQAAVPRERISVEHVCQIIRCEGGHSGG